MARNSLPSLQQYTIGLLSVLAFAGCDTVPMGFALVGSTTQLNGVWRYDVGTAPGSDCLTWTDGELTLYRVQCTSDDIAVVRASNSTLFSDGAFIGGFTVDEVTSGVTIRAVVSLNGTLQDDGSIAGTATVTLTDGASTVPLSAAAFLLTPLP